MPEPNKVVGSTAQVRPTGSSGGRAPAADECERSRRLASGGSGGGAGRNRARTASTRAQRVPPAMAAAGADRGGARPSPEAQRRRRRRWPATEKAARPSSATPARAGRMLQDSQRQSSGPAVAGRWRSPEVRGVAGGESKVRDHLPSSQAERRMGWWQSERKRGKWWTGKWLVGQSLAGGSRGAHGARG
ncbi:inner nuclear membrane protein Man1-like [Ananas comosus]|uniref:Inner nuclear membrane protein Man1-like n=1 Tax=Ananas comosus TaxID=4615 RepID=A0A6P5ERP4_ANACO|nr:inner nuclear membrane protein Man1-like [Ananas comosus]